MLREHLFEKSAPSDPMFRWRGGDVSRLEGLSDGVFAVTLTLLIVSVDVPSTYYELWLTVRDLPIFLASFAMLMMAWRYHYMFFRRYGLEDFPTSLLNGVFLFLVLFYAYPLKFMATFLWRLILRDGAGAQAMFVLPEGVQWWGSRVQGEGMMIFYGLGVAGVFGVLAAMSAYAYRRRQALELDELECLLTVMSVRAHLITVGIAFLSIAIVGAGGAPAWAGLIYFLMGPLHAAHGVLYGRRAERLYAELQRDDRAGTDA